MAGVMAAFLPLSCRGDLFSEASEAFDFQASEVARPPRFERGTLCLFFLNPRSRGERLSESSQVVDFQAFEVARPPRLERGTLCLEELTRAQFPPKY
jgi:hypothetical protein